MRIVFLFGAGASHGSLDCTPACPPLGNSLFDELQGFGAPLIQGELANLFRKNFEQGMAEFWKTRNGDIPSFLRQMSLYFLMFRPGNNNLFLHLGKAMQRSVHKITLATTNYDLLIELALNSIGWRITYHKHPVPSNNASVLKIHGSCNFLPKMMPRQIHNLTLMTTHPNAAILEAPINAVTTTEAINFCLNENSIAPAISMYSIGKKVLFCPSFIQHQQDWFKQEISIADEIFVIGLAVNHLDEHIWMPLSTTNGHITFVAKEQKQKFEEWAELNKKTRRKATFLCDTFEEAFPFIKKTLLHG